MYQLARSLLRQRGARSFLDVGAGPGTKLAELIAPLCSDLVLVDQPSSRELARQLLPGARFIAANLDSIDLQLGRGFDLIACADVLEHLENPVPCLHFIRNHLNPGGIALLYMVSMVLGFFGIRVPYIHDSSPIGIAFSVFVVIIAALNLVLDFDFIERGAAADAPKYMEWVGAFGLLVTLVWLYLEILHLLAKLQGGGRDRR